MPLTLDELIDRLLDLSEREGGGDHPVLVGDYGGGLLWAFTVSIRDPTPDEVSSETEVGYHPLPGVKLCVLDVTATPE